MNLEVNRSKVQQTYPSPACRRRLASPPPGAVFRVYGGRVWGFKLMGTGFEMQALEIKVEGLEFRVMF